MCLYCNANLVSTKYVCLVVLNRVISELRFKYDRVRMELQGSRLGFNVCVVPSSVKLGVFHISLWAFLPLSEGLWIVFEKLYYFLTLFVIYQISLSAHLCRAPTLLRFLLRFLLLFHPLYSYLNPILSFTLWIILIFLFYPCLYSDICTIWLFLLSSLLWHFTPMFPIIIFCTFSELLFNKL